MIGSSAVADRVREAVLAVEGVAGLHAGTFGDVATYLPGRRVSGVRTGKAVVEVHVVVYLDADVRYVAHAVRAAAVAQLERPLPCTVVVEDVVAPEIGDAVGPVAVRAREVNAPETRES